MASTVSVSVDEGEPDSKEPRIAASRFPCAEHTDCIKRPSTSEVFQTPSVMSNEFLAGQ